MDFSKLASTVMSGIKAGLSSIKTAAGNTTAAISSAISGAYQKVVGAAAVVASVAPIASKTAAAIPDAFIKAFPATSTTVAAALTLGGAALAAASSWAIAGYEAYKLLQWKQAAEKSLAEQQANLERARRALGLYPGAVVTAPVEITPTPAPAPSVVPKPTPEPIVKVVPVVTPEVVTKVPPAPGAEVAPGLAPFITVNVAPSPAPNVEVNIPPFPDEMAVTGPLTGAQLMAAIPIMATSAATAEHTQTQNCLPTTGAKLLQAVLGALIPAAIVGGFMFSDTLRGAMTSVAQKFVAAIYSPLTAQAPITPEKGPAIGALLLSQAVMFGSGAHIMSIMAEASAPLKHLGVGYLAAFMADAAGFSRIAAAYQGMMISVGLSGPMKYWAQKSFRPEIPSVGQLLSLAGEYAITREDFNRYMPYHGFTQDWIDRLWELADRPFSPMMFRFLANAGELPEELLDRELKNASFNALSIPTLKKAFMRLAAGELQGQFASSVTGAYRKGLLTQGPFSDHLDNLGYSDRQKERAGYAAELDFAVTLAEEMRATYLAQHKLGQLSDAELGFQLSTLGYRGEKVSADVLGAHARFKPKPEPKVDPAIEKVFRETQTKYVQAYIELYRDGYIDEDQLYEDLISVKVDPDVAHATVFMESAKRLPKLAK